MKRPSALIVAVTLVSGCAPAESGMSGPRQVDTLPSGRVLVTNTELGQWPAGTVWSLVEDLRIGSLDSGREDQFGRIDAIAADESGRIYVVDGLASEVRVFGPDGAPLMVLGGPGRGPTEFAGVVGVNVAGDGRLWVVDAGNNRYMEFEADGSLVTTHPRTVSSFASVPPVALSSGGIVEWAVAESLRAGRRRWVPVRFESPARFDTLGAIEYEFGTVADGLAVTPWDVGLVGAGTPQGDTWVAATATYSVHHVSAGGDTLLSFRRPWAPEPVAATERDSVVAFFDRFGVEVDPDEVPRSKPVVRRIAYDGVDYVYVFPGEIGAPPGSAADVFDVSGQFLGRMALPVTIDLAPDGPAPMATGSHIYARVIDRLGVNHVVRLVIERPEVR